MTPFCGYYICWYANLWDISFTKDVDWDQLLLCIEPHSCLIQQILLDNSSLMYNLHKGFIWIQLKALSRKINNRQIHPMILFHVCCRIPAHLSPFAVVFIFWGNSIIRIRAWRCDLWGRQCDQLLLSGN